MLLNVDQTTVILQGMHLMITPTLDLGVFVLESIG